MSDRKRRDRRNWLFAWQPSGRFHVGGEDARETLEDLLENAEDDEEAEILEEALDNLSFTDDQHTFGINL